MALLTRTLSNNKINGTVNVPQSSSLIHRHLICGALSDSNYVVHYENNSKDVKATLKCIENLGLYEKESLALENCIYRLECGQSDWAYKFLMPLAAAMGKECIFSLKGNLVFVSMDSFYRVLRTHGLKREILRPDLVKVTGHLTAGTYILPGVSDGQALSGLLMALPLLKENSTVMAEKKPQSEMYVDMTIDIMRKSGIKIDVLKDQNGLSRVYKIPGRQTYNLHTEEKIENDWSLAAYWLTGAAISGGEVTCVDMNIDSLQGDKRILNILKLFGAEIEAVKHEEPDAIEDGQEIYWSDVTVKGAPLKGVNIDAEDIPDLLGPVLLLASMAEGVSIIRNVENLRVSTEQVKNTVEAMEAIGAQITLVTDGILINGNAGVPLEGGRVGSHRDYKIIMMAAIAASVCKEAVVIENTDEVDSGYPEFFDELERLKR